MPTKAPGTPNAGSSGGRQIGTKQSGPTLNPPGDHGGGKKVLK